MNSAMTIRKLEDLEFRKTPRLGRENEHYYEIVKWVEAEDAGGKPYCYTLIMWTLNSEGWDIEFVGNRPFTYINRDSLNSGIDCKKFWSFLEYCQAYLNNEFRFEENLKW